jgi:hypothetical protein
LYQPKEDETVQMNKVNPFVVSLVHSNNKDVALRRIGQNYDVDVRWDENFVDLLYD